MNTRSIVRMALACLTLTAVFSVVAQASERDRKTIVNISAPAEIPGRVLLAGTYVIQRIGTEGNIVQILNKDGNKVIATLLTIPEEVAATPRKPMFAISESMMGAPEAIRAWYYPGDNTGLEFVYPKAGMHRQALARMNDSKHSAL